MRRGVTKKELLLAVAMSEYYSKSLVYFIPAGTTYTGMLVKMRSQKFVESVSSANKHFKLSEKSRKYILRQDIEKFRNEDALVDKFIDNL